MDQITEVKLLKALHNVSYGSVAKELGINRNSLYNWMRGAYSFSKEMVLCQEIEQNKMREITQRRGIR